MIWKIAKKEFQLNLMIFKFAVGTIFCIVLMAVFVPILVKDYEQRFQKYNKLLILFNVVFFALRCALKKGKEPCLSQ